MEERYGFTPEGLHNLSVYGVRPAQAWSALTAVRRVVRHLGDDLDEADVKAVFADTEGGHVVVFLAESDRDDNDWDILAYATARRRYAAGALSAQGRRLPVVDPAEVDDDLVREVTEILTSVCAPLYGRRAAANPASPAAAAAIAEDPT